MSLLLAYVKLHAGGSEWRIFSAARKQELL